MENKKKKNYVYFFILIGVCLSGGVSVLINPILTRLAEAYPDVSMTTIRGLSTLNLPVSVTVSLLLSGTLGYKIKFRPFMILGSVFMLTSAIPFFINPCPFWVIMASRMLLAVGLGIMALRYACIRHLFEGDEAETAKWIGWGSFIVSGTAVVLQPIAGALADINYRYAFALHLILVIPLVLNILFLKDEGNVNRTDEKEVKPTRGKLNAKVFVCAFTMIATALFSYPIFTGMSTLVKARAMGAATETGYITSFYTIGQVAVSAVFGWLVKKIGKQTVAVGSLIMAIGFGLIVVSYSLPLSILGGFLCGFGFTAMNLSNIKLAGDFSDEGSKTFATTILSMSVTIGCFFSTYWIVAANKIGVVFSSFLGTDAERTYLIATILFVIIAVVFSIYWRSVDKKESKK